jgi:mercuric ion binding protein
MEVAIMHPSAQSVLFVALLSGLIAAPSAVRAQERVSQGPAAAVAGGPERITVTVTGLSCPFCAYGLEKRLRKLDGLDSLSIDFKTGSVVLTVRDGSLASDARLRQLVKEAGFEATKIERSPLPPAS